MGSVPVGRGGGEHSPPFSPGAGRALPAAGPKPAAASQEPLAQKWRQGFSKGFSLRDFLCFASPRPQREAFPRRFSAAGASGRPPARWQFHADTSPCLGRPSGSGRSSARPVLRKPHPHPSSSRDPPHAPGTAAWSPPNQRHPLGDPPDEPPLYSWRCSRCRGEGSDWLRWGAGGGSEGSRHPQPPPHLPTSPATADAPAPTAVLALGQLPRSREQPSPPGASQ